MGGALDLHPILVITGVFVGATVWGILGALIAAPMIATFKEIFGYIFYKLAWEEPKTKYQAQPEEETGILQGIKNFFQRYKRKKTDLQSIAEEIISPSTSPENDLMKRKISAPPYTIRDTEKDSQKILPAAQYSPSLYNQDHTMEKRNPRTYPRSGSIAFILLLLQVYSSILNQRKRIKNKTTRTGKNRLGRFELFSLGYAVATISFSSSGGVLSPSLRLRTISSSSTSTLINAQPSNSPESSVSES